MFRYIRDFFVWLGIFILWLLVSPYLFVGGLIDDYKKGEGMFKKRNI